VALSSIASWAAEPGLAAYGATKAALNMFCESITSDEGSNGVLATATAPGYVDTDMAAWVHDSIAPEQMMKTSDSPSSPLRSPACHPRPRSPALS
jgi:3-oxoacyl-[acyl-carrier protein] reductase